MPGPEDRDHDLSEFTVITGIMDGQTGITTTGVPVMMITAVGPDGVLNLAFPVDVVSLLLNVSAQALDRLEG